MKSVPAGCSGKPLSAKLGLKQGIRAAFINAPEHLAGLLDDVWFDIHHVAPENAAFVHLFAHSGDEVRGLATQLHEVFDSNEVIWISWPKKSSGVVTEITEDHLRGVDIAIRVGGCKGLCGGCDMVCAKIHVA